jgi:hypothetical protein
MIATKPTLSHHPKINNQRQAETKKEDTTKFEDRNNDRLRQFGTSQRAGVEFE